MKATKITLNEVIQYYGNQHGPQVWLQDGTDWARVALEVIYGSILVQNTNWKNVAPSLLNSKQQLILIQKRLNI